MVDRSGQWFYMELAADCIWMCWKCHAHFSSLGHEERLTFLIALCRRP